MKKDSNIKNEPIAHLFQHAGPHLCKGIVPFVLEEFPNAKIYMRSPVPAGVNDENISSANRKWIENVPTENWGGYLVRGGIWRCFKGDWGRRLATVLSNTILPYYGITSWEMIWKGPKRWVYHSCIPMNIPTQFVFWLMGKEVVAIHWGLPLGHIPCVWPLVNLAHNFAKKIFVLMTPEKEFFKPLISSRKIGVLSYPTPTPKFRWENFKPSQSSGKVMVLGNSTYNRDWYGPVLDKIPAGSWDKIICMLNYGREEEFDLTDAFVAKYQAKFGTSFVAWRETIPFDEYMKVMNEASYYVGPAPEQSGLGAIFNMMSMDKTIIIRGHNFAWIKELGCDALNLDDFNDLSYETVSKRELSPEQRRANFACLNHFFEEVNTKECWAETVRRAFE